MHRAMEWKSSLSRYRGGEKSEAAKEQETLAVLKALYQEEQKKKGERNATVIPRFFRPKSDAPGEAAHRWRREARIRRLERRELRLLDDAQLASLWTIICERAIPESSTGEGEKMLSYDGFCQVRAEVFHADENYIRPSTFAKLPRDGNGCVSALAFYTYICKKVRLARLRVSLMVHDELGLGYLREQDLENFVFEKVPQMAGLANLESDFFPYYVFTAVRKLIFFLDPARKGRIAIRDLLHSSVLHEFLSLRHAKGQPPPETGGPVPPSSQFPPATPGAPVTTITLGTKEAKARANSNWFTPAAALAVYATYINLDSDRNGMLSKREFLRWGSRSLTETFVDRLWEEYRMYMSKEGELEMDYKTYLDFVLAMENRHLPQGLTYFWRVFDMEKKGYLTVANLHYFFKSVMTQLSSPDQGEPQLDPVDVVTNEIFDMIGPSDPHRITFEDLVSSGHGATIVSILIDVNGFWRYDNREMLVADDSPSESAGLELGMGMGMGLDLGMGGEGDEGDGFGPGLHTADTPRMGPSASPEPDDELERELELLLNA